MKKRKIVAALVFVFMMVACLISCSFARTEDADDKTGNLYTSEITVGYGEASELGSKPMPSQCVALKCHSSFQKDKKVIVDAAMGDQYSYFQKFGGEPTYDTFGNNGYPIFEVFDVGETHLPYPEPAAGTPLLINGKNEPFEKKFNKEDMTDLDISGNQDDISKYHHESVELDFSNFEIGEMGTVYFSFAWFFEHGNPYYSGQPNIPWCGTRRALNYYIGENGMMLSSNCASEAKEAYYNLFPESDVSTDGAITLSKDTDEPICSAKPLYLLCINDNEAQYAHGSVIERQYEIKSVYDDSCYDIEITASEDITLLSEAHFQVDLSDRNIFSIRFKLTDACESGDLAICVAPVSYLNGLAADKSPCYRNIYYCHENDCDYISLNSLSSLAAYSKKLENYFDMLNRQGEYMEIVNTPISEQIGITDAEIMATMSSYTVNGYIRWRDSGGNSHPAQGVSVEIYNRNGTSSVCLGSVTTDSSGYYSKNLFYNGTSKDIYIKAYSKGVNISVEKPTGGTYIYTSSTNYGIEGGDTATISCVLGKDSDFSRALSVHQAMALANRYMYGLEGDYLNPITVSFPDDSKGTSCYSSSEGKIYILEGDAFDWDVLEHEYGHYVQSRFNIANSPGGSHIISNNLADARSDKSQGIRLAWGEGWATYFAIHLQNKMSASSLNIPNVGDTVYQDTEDNIVEYDIEFLESKYRLGEANEAAVSAVLYDITDGINTAGNENDYIACNNTEIWSITKSSHCTTLSEFIAAFNNSAFTTQVKLNLGSTLSQYSVAAKLYTPAGLSTSTPSFGWSKQGGSTSYPNNRFRLAFFDSSYNLILWTNYVNSTSQELTSSQWTRIKNSGSTAYCCVETCQTSTPQTGRYYSNLITINLLTGSTHNAIADIVDQDGEMNEDIEL